MLGDQSHTLFGSFAFIQIHHDNVVLQTVCDVFLQPATTELSKTGNKTHSQCTFVCVHRQSLQSIAKMQSATH